MLVQIASALLLYWRRKDICTEQSVMASEPTSINTLPDEILLKILSHFGPEDLCLNIAEVCERWNALAKDMILWKALSFSCDRSSDISHTKKVFRNAPALHSLIIRSREDAADILEFPNHKHVDLRKLILKYCYFGEDGPGLLANILSLYPQLEVLSLESCRPLISAAYCLISRLKKLSELNLSGGLRMAYNFNDDVFTKSFTPREYQVELLDAAKERNIIVCLRKSSSKTFIATKLIQELASAVRRPFRHGGKRTLYLVDTVAMVAQQALYIRHLTDLSVGEYVSVDTVDMFGVEDWKQQFQGNQIMKDYLSCFEQPRILGLTASLLNSTCDPGRLEGVLRRLELVLHSTAETASDILSFLRYCTKPKELLVECSLPTPGTLDKELENQIKRALAFLTDHSHDPSEAHEDEFQEELKGIPDPKIDPQKILNDFLDVLHTLGPLCAYHAALVFLNQLDKPKVKNPCEQRFHLLRKLSSVMVQVRATCDDFFQKYDEKERMYKFSSPKVLRLLEILRQFKPEKLPHDKQEENETKLLPRVKNSAVSASVSENTVVAKHGEVCVSDTKVVSTKENRIQAFHMGTQKNRLILNMSKSYVCKERGCCGCNIGDVLKEAENLCVCHNDDRQFKMLGEEQGQQSGETYLHLPTCTNFGVSAVDSVKDDVCEDPSNEVSIAKFVPTLERCTSCESDVTDAMVAGVPLLCREFDSNRNCKVSVIEGAFEILGNDDCEKMKAGKIDDEIIKENSVKNAKVSTMPVTPLKRRTDLYSRNRGSRFSRRSYQKEDVGGPVRGRNDPARRQYHSLQQDDVDALCGIIFVEQRFTAKILYNFLDDLRQFDEDFTFLMTQYTIDKVADPVTDPREAKAERRKQEKVLKRFRARECNLLVCTAVLEEGIDIPKCNLVIHFNEPQAYRSYVQSKGRACAQDAYYILMIEEARTAHFVNELAQYFEIEQMLLRKCANQEPSEEEELEADNYTNHMEAYNPVGNLDSPSVSMSTAIALVNRYCAKLPSNNFTRLTPLWSIKTIIDNAQTSYVCTVRLPIRSPVKQDIVGQPMPSRVLARRIAALETCKVLHQAQELDDNLVPFGKESFRVREEDEATLARDELDETIPWDSSEPCPCTSKRRQYYYKRIADALTDCRPVPAQPAYLYHISMMLTCPLPEEQNTRGRKIYPPEDSPQGFGILTLKQIPKICPFPIFTQSGEVSVKLELAGSSVVLTPDNLEKIVSFLNYTFTSVLQLQKYLMIFDPQASKNSYFIVPTIKLEGSTAEVDWKFLEGMYENRDLQPHPVPEEERVGFTFEAAKYHDAVIMPWYLIQDRPQYFYVAEICGHLNPKSSFPGSQYKTFDEYYFKKYGIQIQNSKQPLLDVEGTSARLNFLTPRYVNRKGVALSTSSEETKRAKRENLEQKHILVPELCTLHPFPASLWRKAVCLPFILYRINALLLADQIRREVAVSIALGHENLSADFEWPPLDFGWNLADTLKKSKENVKNNDQDKDEKGKGGKVELASIEDTEEEPELKERSGNEVLMEEEEKKLCSDWMENGTWSNNMASHDPILGTSQHRIEFKGENVVEAIEDEHLIQKRERRHTIIRQNSDTSGTEDEISWDWKNDSDEDSDKLMEKFVDQFWKATEKNRHFIENSGILVKSNQAVVINKTGSQQQSLSDNTGVSLSICKSAPSYSTLKDELSSHEQNLPDSGCIKTQSNALKPASVLCPDEQDNKDSGLSVDGSSEELEAEAADALCDGQFEVDNMCKDSDPEEDIISKFSFDAQPNLEGHPGPSPSVILQALTMTNANDGIDLERLETLGDSFLKYAITTYLYCTYDNIHEGKLSHLRSKQVSNLNLYRLGHQKMFGESMIAAKFEPHDNWLPPCYYVPRELEKALIKFGVPTSHWNQVDLPDPRNLSCDEISKPVCEWSEKLHKMSVGENDLIEDMPTACGLYTNIENRPRFFPYNLITQHSIPDKSVADCVEALIGAYLIACGPRGALLFMAWLGLCVLPKEEVILTASCSDSRPVGSLVPELVMKDENSTASVERKQVRYGTLKAPRSPLLRNVSNPEAELNRLLSGYEVFERRIGYKFRNRSYLLQSLTHTSYSPNRLTGCYQRLEFLGDAVLAHVLIIRRSKLHYTASVIITLKQTILLHAICMKILVITLLVLLLTFVRLWSTTQYLPS